MKIGFSGHYDGPGGARSWIRAFSRYCLQKGHHVSFGPDPHVDVFCSIANISKLHELQLIKSHGIKILQRLGAIYLKYNDPRQDVLDRLNNNLKTLTSYSDTIVYQSHFSKEVLFRSIYDGHEPDGDIIYNTTNKSIFTPLGPILDRPRDKKVILAIAYWGTPHTSIQSLKILIQLAYRLRQRKDIEVWVLGQAFPRDEALVKDAALPNITHLNLHTPIDYHDIPKYLRTADMLLHLKAHEGCSNLVIEAMHTGTPLVGIHSGSLPELVDDAAQLASCTQDIDTFPHVNMDDLYAKVIHTIDHLDDYQERMLARASLFDETTLYEQYLSLIHALVHK